MTPRVDKQPVEQQSSPPTSQLSANAILDESADIVIEHIAGPEPTPSIASDSSNTKERTLEAIVATNSTEAAANSLFGIEMPFDVLSAAYAALVASGGLIGYFKAGSVPSLMAGLAFGSILGVGTYMTSVNPDNYYLTLGTSTVLGSFMGYRFYNSGKFMPAGLITILSLGMILRFSVRALTHTQHYRK